MIEETEDPMPQINNQILIDPTVAHGKPVIKGTRVPVSVVVGSLAAGMSYDEVQSEYNLTREDIQVALAFANELIQQESFHNIPHVA